MPDVYMPENAQELAEVMNNPAKLTAVNQAYKNRGGMKAFFNDYAAQADDGSITAKVNEAKELELIKMFRNGDFGSRVPTGEAPASAANRLRSFINTSPNAYNKGADGAQLDNDFRDVPIGQLFSDIIHHHNGTLSANASKRMSKLSGVMNAMSSKLPASGGFLIPEQFRADILSLALTQSIVRPRATVFPMANLELNIPTIDETTRATSVYGGITFGTAEESATLTVTEPRFGRVKLVSHKVYWYTHIPNELVDDAPVLNTWLAAKLPGAYANYEDSLFLNGGGVGEPLGVINAPGRIAITRTTASLIAYEDLVNMLARMLPASLNKAVWVASNETIPQLYNMVKTIKNVAGTENVGGASTAFVIDMASGAPTTLFGRPIFYTDNVPQLGTTGDIGLYDMSEYIIGDRMAWQVKASEHYRFQNDETAVRGIARVDGRPWVPSAITPKNGGDTLSPYVVLGPAA